VSKEIIYENMCYIYKKHFFVITFALNYL